MGYDLCPVDILSVTGENSFINNTYVTEQNNYNAMFAANPSIALLGYKHLCLPLRKKLMIVEWH